MSPRLRSLLLTLGLLTALIAPASAVAAFGPLQPADPFTGPTGAATMHGDSGSSDTTPFPGPGGAADLPVRTTSLGAACPAIVIGRDARPVALCTRQTDRAPIVHLLDPATGASLAFLLLPAGNLFGGVYTYIDQDDRLVLVNGQGHLIRIAHRQDAAGAWSLKIVGDVDLSPALKAACGGTLCGGVVGLAPDFQGRVWVAAATGVAGVVDPATGVTKTVKLGSGETVANSISTSPHATSIVTTKALYELDVDRAGTPRILWRAPYDRGPYRKPGQLSHGSGATPSYFGPVHGSEYLTITDNADPRANLLVYDALASRRARAPRLICRIPVLPAGASGTENSPIESGRSVFVASSYGYPYPAYPDDAGPIAPTAKDGEFPGGMTRIDVDADGKGCHEVWTNTVRSAAVPKLSVADGLIYTTVRRGLSPLDPAATSALDSYAFTAIDAGTGKQLGTTYLGATTLGDTLQLAGNASPSGGVYWQGSVSGVSRIGDGSVRTPSSSAVGTLEPATADPVTASEALAACGAGSRRGSAGRRLAISSAAIRGGRLTLRLRSRGARPRTATERRVVVERRTACGRWTRIGVRSRGTGTTKRLALAAPAGADATVIRVRGHVRASRNGRVQAATSAVVAVAP